MLFLKKAYELHGIIGNSNACLVVEGSISIYFSVTLPISLDPAA